MYIDGQPTKLKIGDLALFRSKDRVVQFCRGSQRLTNEFGDDKHIVSNQNDLEESECSHIAQIIAESHGFSVINQSYLYKNSGYFRFAFIKKKKKKKEEKSGQITLRIKVRKNKSVDPAK